MDRISEKMQCDRIKSETYQIAEHRFAVNGDCLCKAINDIAGFRPFRVEECDDVLFSFVEGTDVPNMVSTQYQFFYEDVIGHFGCTDKGFMLKLKPVEESAFYMWVTDGENAVQLKGNWSLRLYRFALWVGYGLMVLPFNTVAIHSSCIVHNDKAILFLGESGTGKSTHTRLWREHIDGTFLLNDDSPIIRVEDGKVWVYGSPWSGKTPCYKQERYELVGCVRLSQAPFNQIRKLSVLQSYGAIHPSCPPEFAYDSNLYDPISQFIDKLITNTPFYHLACLPNKEAAELSFHTLFKETQ